MKNKIWENDRLIISSAIFFSTFVQLISLPQSINHDLSSYLSPAVALLENYGLPYKDYFDIKPPLSIFFLYAWIFFFGYSLYSLAVLNFIILTIFFYCFYKILLKISKTIFSPYIFFFTITISITSAHFEMFLSTEIIGNFFIFLSIYLFFYFKDTQIKWFIIGLLCFIAGQIKEVYFFCIIAFFILSFYEKLNSKKLFTQLILGWSSGLLLTVFLLYQNNILIDYIDIIYFKKQVFNVKLISYVYHLIKTFWSFALHLNIFFLLFCFLIFKIYLINKKIILGNVVKNYLAEEKSLFLLIILLSMLIGFTWQFKVPYDHYFLSIWFFLILVFYSIILKLYSLSKIRYLFTYNNFLACLMITISILTNIMIFDKSEFYKIKKNIGLFSKNFKHEFYQKERFTKIKGLLNNDSCVQSVYGWNSGSLHIYSGKRPCSKFFLSNLIINEKIEKTYRKELLMKPPKLVVYVDVDENTINKEQFENKIFPWNKIITKCYYELENISNYYFSRFTQKEMKNCFNNLLIESKI
jgi:hypothetical protein